MLSSLLLMWCNSQESIQLEDETISLEDTNLIFQWQFNVCKNDVSKCDLGRDAEISWVISKIHLESKSTNFPSWTLVLSREWKEGIVTSYLSSEKENREVILINSEGDISTSIEEFNEWDTIVMKMKNFDIIDKGIITETLGQYILIQQQK